MLQERYREEEEEEEEEEEKGTVRDREIESERKQKFIRIYFDHVKCDRLRSRMKGKRRGEGREVFITLFYLLSICVY